MPDQNQPPIEEARYEELSVTDLVAQRHIKMAAIPGPYADDAAAKAAGIPVGGFYHKTGEAGTLHIVLS